MRAQLIISRGRWTPMVNIRQNQLTWCNFMDRYTELEMNQWYACLHIVNTGNKFGLHWGLGPMDSSLTLRAGLVKVIQLLAILVAWENWKERNARIFQQHHSTQESLIAKNNEEARTLCLPGGNRLKEIIWSSPVVEVYDFTPQPTPHPLFSIPCLN